MLLVLAGATCRAPSAVLPVVETPVDTPVTEWRLVWTDDFDGPAGARPDSARWRADLGDGCAQGICGWGNGEKEYYSDASDNLRLTGTGQLAIIARVATPGLTCSGAPCRYTSAKITTRGLMNASPGRVEARIKLPAGQGLWPAFWMLGHDHPNTSWPACGELDIMENRGSQPDVVSSAVHGPGYAGAASFNGMRALTTAADGFHVYAVEWNTTDVRFFVDSSLAFSVSRVQVQAKGPWVFDQSFYVILNLAVGGHFDGDPQSDAIFPATMMVDYVRVYTKSR